MKISTSFLSYSIFALKIAANETPYQASETSTIPDIQIQHHTTTQQEFRTGELPSSLRCFKPIPHTTPCQVEELNVELEQVVHALKSYVWECFDWKGFRKSSRELEKTLMRINKSVENISCTTKVLMQLAFANHMFGAMKKSTEWLTVHNSIRGTDTILVNKVIQLNIRCLFFLDSSGVPDPSTIGYVTSVLRFSRVLKAWETSFNKVPSRSPSLVRVFKSQFSNAESILAYLKSYIPDHRKF
ncbi:hypothetical protein JCM33374_g1718 [Metschnikowia sp. JCM 33374]|nr:hypothetical protein JCM33374_g1718 [Metschnikowia sp. JCM 33374]